MASEKQTYLDYDSWNLSKCDRCIFNLMRQHLMPPDKNRSNLTKEEGILRHFKHFFEEIGLLVVSTNGKIKFITKKAEYLLKKYSLSLDQPILPELLQHWFKYQINQSMSIGNVQLWDLPLNIEKAEQKLVIRLITDAREGKYFLLLEERELQAFTVDSLELLGLTKREAEVLFWIAKDKSNGEISSILGCTKGTVRKHLEHVYRKLGVQTRIGAVMVAMEKLGLLEGKFVANSS